MEAQLCLLLLHYILDVEVFIVDGAQLCVILWHYLLKLLLGRSYFCYYYVYCIYHYLLEFLLLIEVELCLLL
jgi:hypothetical protein